MKKIAVLGLGKVGALAALLLKEARFVVTGFDQSAGASKYPFETIQIDLGPDADLTATLEGFGAVLSCLPYSLNTNPLNSLERRVLQLHGQHRRLSWQ